MLVGCVLFRNDALLIFEELLQGSLAISIGAKDLIADIRQALDAAGV